MTIREAIRMVVEGRQLSREETRQAFTIIMSGEATEAQIAAFLVGLRIKKETVEEITGAVEVMRDKALPVEPASTEFLLDTCGTGGDGSNTFNISTAVAFVAAAAGARVAKHGNRSISSRCGSADVLEALGVKITGGPETMKRCLDEVGIAFLFAPTLHKAMKYAIKPRREIAVRTIFNVLGPLTNPANAPHQLLGVFAPELTDVCANVLRNCNSLRAYVVHGLDTMDEISLSNKTRVSELARGKVLTYWISPKDFGFSEHPHEAFTGDSPQRNADIIRDIFKGKSGPCRDIVVLNAAFALAASGKADSPQDGIALAAEAIDSGGAMEKVVALAKKTNES